MSQSCDAPASLMKTIMRKPNKNEKEEKKGGRRDSRD